MEGTIPSALELNMVSGFPIHTNELVQSMFLVNQMIPETASIPLECTC